MDREKIEAEEEGMPGQETCANHSRKEVNEMPGPQGEREFEIGRDEAWSAILLKMLNNCKRTYDEYQNESLESVRVNRAYVQKVIRTLDLSTNGPAVSAALLARAAKLRALDEVEEAAGGGLFDIAEWVVNPFSLRERLEKEAMRL